MYGALSVCLVLKWQSKPYNKEGQFLWERGVFIMCYCCIETLLQVLLGIVNYFIGYYLFSLYYCCFTCFVSIEIGKTESAILVIQTPLPIV